AYFKWFDRCLFISNMLTRSLPPKIGLRVESAMISRLFCGFCRLFLRMWSHTLETTWLRGSGELPVIFARSADGVTGRANPPPALRPSAIWALLLICHSCRAQSAPLCNGDSALKSEGATAEWNHFVRAIMSDIGAKTQFDAGAGAPIGDDRLLIRTEMRIVFRNIGGPPETDSSNAAYICARSHMEHQAVDPVVMLAHFLDQQLHSREIRFENGPEESRQHGQVEGHCRLAEIRLDCGRIPPHQPVERAVHRRLATLAQNVLRHRAVRDLQA